MGNPCRNVEISKNQKRFWTKRNCVFPISYLHTFQMDPSAIFLQEFCISAIHLEMGHVRMCHSSHQIATQSSHFVDRDGWQAKMASIEFWIPWRNAHAPHYHSPLVNCRPYETEVLFHNVLAAMLQPFQAVHWYTIRFRFCQSFTSNFPSPFPFLFLSLPLPFLSSSFPFDLSFAL